MLSLESDIFVCKKMVLDFKKFPLALLCLPGETIFLYLKCLNNLFVLTVY